MYINFSESVQMTLMWVSGPTAHMSQTDFTFTYTEQGKKNQLVSSLSAASAVRLDTEPPRRHNCNDSVAQEKAWRRRRRQRWRSAEDLVSLRSGCQQLQTFSGSMGREMALCVSGKLAPALKVEKGICIEMKFNKTCRANGGKKMTEQNRNDI